MNITSSNPVPMFIFHSISSGLNLIFYGHIQFYSLSSIIYIRTFSIYEVEVRFYFFIFFWYFILSSASYLIFILFFVIQFFYLFIYFLPSASEDHKNLLCFYNSFHVSSLSSFFLLFCINFYY